MSNLTEALGHKIGPMPAGAWIALVAGGLGIAYYTRTHSAAPVEAPASLDDTQLGTVPLASSSGAQTSDRPGTNEEWQSKAVTYLIAQGATGTAADSAIRNYLAGNTLTASQTALVDLVLAAMGPPPVAPPLPVSGLVGDDTGLSSGGTSTSTQTATAAAPIVSAGSGQVSVYLGPTYADGTSSGNVTVQVPDVVPSRGFSDPVVALADATPIPAWAGQLGVSLSGRGRLDQQTAYSVVTQAKAQADAYKAGSIDYNTYRQRVENLDLGSYVDGFSWFGY